MTIRLLRHLNHFAPAYRGSVVTIGSFDGIHKGHQALLSRVVMLAKAEGVTSLVVTFEPHPAEYFAKGKAVLPRLTRLREKIHAIERCGVDAVLVLPFDKAMAELSAADFIQRILVKTIQIRHMVVGDDFHFGKGRQGNFEFLQKMGREHGFQVESMSTLLIAGERASSTRVRQALQQEDHALAERLLGRPYCMEGRVVHGDKRGRSIGFPTANIFVHRQVTPVKGVYAVRMHGIAAYGLPGVANIGTRPTVGGTRTLLEVYLYDFNQDIYQRQVSVEFCKKLREEEYYENIDLLIEQIKRDAAAGRDYFAKC